MNINAMKLATTRIAGRGLLLTKKHSPAILTATGIASGVVAAVLGAKATLKLEPILDATKEKLTESKGRLEREVITTDEHQRAMGAIYTRSAIDIFKLYAPAVSLGATSIVCIVSAQGIMQKRNVALVAAYTAVEKGFAEYRERVAAELGEEKEFELRYPTTDIEVVDQETGEVTIAKTMNPNDVSIYAKFFDQLNDHWEKRPDFNMIFLKTQQNFANDKLRTQGHIFLNEVYDMLGIERTSAGSVVGWVISKDGDNFVDFGLLNGNREAVREFVNGREAAILLDFNVDGVIYDKI